MLKFILHTGFFVKNILTQDISKTQGLTGIKHLQYLHHRAANPATEGLCKLSFIDIMTLGHTEQPFQDCVENITHLIEGLGNKNDCFLSRTKNTVICNKCQIRTVTYHNLPLWTIPISHFESSLTTITNTNNSVLTSPCPTCGSQLTRSVRLEPVAVASQLIIHLDRAKWLGNKIMFDSNSISVRDSINISSGDKIRTWELDGFIQYHQDSKHYTTIVKENSTWFKFDSNRKVQTSISSRSHSNTILLSYSEISTQIHLPSGESVQTTVVNRPIGTNLSLPTECHFKSVLSQTIPTIGPEMFLPVKIN